MTRIFKQIIDLMIPVATYILFLYNYTILNAKHLIIISMSILSVLYILTVHSNHFIAYVDYCYLQPGLPRLIMQIGRQILNVIDYFKPPLMEYEPEPLYDTTPIDVIYFIALTIYGNNPTALFLLMFLPSLYCVLSSNDNYTNITDSFIKFGMATLTLDG